MEYYIESPSTSNNPEVLHKGFAASLFPGKKLYSEVGDSVTDVRLYVVDDEGNITDEILEDGSVVSLSETGEIIENGDGTPEGLRFPSELPKTGDDFPIGELLGLLGTVIVVLGWLGFRIWHRKLQL